MKTIPRHGRPFGMPGWVARLRDGGFASVQHHGSPVPKVPPGRMRADPLASVIAITERAVFGDQLRKPIAWCEMAPCVSRYEDPAALGEADIRARAIGAGWRHDDVGCLACPACQQRSPQVWATYPVVQQDQEPAREHRKGASHARPGVITRLRSTAAAWYRDLSRGQDRRPRWPHLLAALASGGNGWNTRHWDPAQGPSGRTGGGGQVTAVLPSIGQPATSPAKQGGDDHRRKKGQQRENDRGHEHVGAGFRRLMPSAHSALPRRHRSNRIVAPAPASAAHRSLGPKSSRSWLGMRLAAPPRVQGRSPGQGNGIARD